MTTTSGARTAVQALLEARAPIDGLSVPVALHWQDENEVVLPDVPKPFVYTEFQLAGLGRIVSFEGGARHNRYRTFCRIDAYAFVPIDRGISEAESIAEQIASVFRSYRDAAISCSDATVVPAGKGERIKPPMLTADVTNYLWTIATISLFFDQVGSI